MSKEYRMKFSVQFLTLVLILACLPLFSSLSKYIELDVDLPSVRSQISIIASNLDRINYTSNNAWMPVTDIFPTMDSNAIQLNHAHIQDQNLFGDGQIYTKMPLCALLCGVSFLFLCFGALIDIFFVRKFTRYMVIPHSIHAPPFQCRETFEISGQRC